MDDIPFIERKFKNLETKASVDFNKVIESSQISVILGEPASGKTFQLKSYHENHKKSVLLFIKLLSKYEESDIKKYNLLDSIDEALAKNKDDDELILDLVNFIKKNKKKKKNFVLTCRYLEWKEIFEEKLKKIDKDIKIYEILPLDKKDINKLLDKKEININDFWNFIEENHLDYLLRNIIVVNQLINDFQDKYQHKQVDYMDIYQDIVESSIKLKGDNRTDTRRRVIELLPWASSLATYMLLNKKDLINKKDIDDIENFSDELYEINNQTVSEENLKRILNSGLFISMNSSTHFTFFHKSIQEYLMAYFIKEKNLNFEKIKDVFAHNLRFYEEFEEVIIYLTNMQPNLFDNLVDFDPFIFRRHPSLTAEQQEKLLLSIINKLQNSESYAWDRVNFFYSSSLVKFDKLDIFSFIKDKNIKNTQSNILLQYVMRLFSENYSEQLEEFIFEILATKIDNRLRCREFISYSYNDNQEYNKKLFKFMKEHALFMSQDSDLFLTKDYNYNNLIEVNLFFSLTKDKLPFQELLPLLNYLENKAFIEKVNLLVKQGFNDISDLRKWFDYLFKLEIKLESFSNLRDNIECLVYILIIYYPNIDSIFEKLTYYCNKHEIFFNKNDFNKINFNSFQPYINASALFYTIQENFWHFYFSDKVQSFDDVSGLLGIYHINVSDIENIPDKYSIEDDFIKTFEFIEYLERRDLEIEKVIFSLSAEQEKKLLEKFKSIKSIEEDEVLLKWIMKLLQYSCSQELVDFVFEILEGFVDEKQKCRQYIELSYNIDYDYNVKLFYFMKKNDFFVREVDKLRLFDNQKTDVIAKEMYYIFYLNNMEKELLFENWLYLLEYIEKGDFYHIAMDPKFNLEDIESFFKFINGNNEHLGTIIFRILTDKKEPTTSLKEMITLFQKFHLNVPKPSHIGFHTENSLFTIKDYSIYPLFYTIQNEFWKIYFNDDINSFREIENFISLYRITIEDIDVAIEKHHINKNDKKYIDLYHYIDSKIDKKELEYRAIIKENNLEKNWFNILIYNFNNVKRDSSEYQVFLSIHNKIKEDLREQYRDFIEIMKNNYLNSDMLINTKKNILFEYPKDNAYNFLFSTFSLIELQKFISTKEEKENFSFWIILECISITEPIKSFINNNFEIFLDAVIEYIKLSFETYSEEEKNEFSLNPSLLSSNPYGYFKLFHFQKLYESGTPLLKELDGTQLKKLILFLVALKESDFKLFEYQFLEIVSLDIEQYEFIKTKMLLSEDPFYYLSYLMKLNLNRAMDDFYKYIYNSLPQKMVYSLNKSPYVFSSSNSLFNKYLSQLSFELEKKLDKQKEFKRKLLDFYKDKNSSYNVVKIILFDKLLNLLNHNIDFKNLDEKYIECILINYYMFFKEEKVPTSKDYSEKWFLNNDKSKSSQIIIRIWGYLQNNVDENSIQFLEKLKSNANQYISDSAEYALLKLFEKKGRERNYENDYYKYIFNQVIEKNNITNNYYIEEVKGVVVNKGEVNQSIS